MTRNPFWSEEEERLGAELMARKVSPAEFIKALGRTKGAYHAHMRQKTHPRTTPTAVNAFHVINGRITVPDDVLAEAFRRQTARRSLTAAVFGDPAPGFSALDRKRAEAQS